MDLNTLLSRMDRKFRQEIKKETADLNNTIDQMDLTNIYTAFHLHVSQVHIKYNRIDYMIGHKTSLSKFRED